MCERGDGVGRGSRRRRLACVAATASGVCQPSARAASGCIFKYALHNRCVSHRAQRPSNASHRWRRICARAARGQQMDLHPEIFASSVARRAFQATPVHMRYRNASMRLCSDAELQRIEIRALALTMCVSKLSRTASVRAQAIDFYTGREDPSLLGQNKTEEKQPQRKRAVYSAVREQTRYTLTYTSPLRVRRRRRRRRTRTPGPPPLPRRVAHAALVDDERSRADRPTRALRQRRRPLPR